MSILGRALSTQRVLLVMITALAISISTGAYAACVSDPDAAQKGASFIGDPLSLLDGPNGPRSPEEVAMMLKPLLNPIRRLCQAC
jgi:hypothetical protein